MKNRSIPAYIYELIDPDDGKTYYVGKSHQPHERFRQHLEDARDRLGTRKGMWLKSLVDRGRAPKLRIVSVHLDHLLETNPNFPASPSSR